MAKVHEGYIVCSKSRSEYVWESFYPFDVESLLSWCDKELINGNKDLVSIQPATATTVKRNEIPRGEHDKSIWITKVKREGTSMDPIASYQQNGIVYKVEPKERPLNKIETDINKRLNNARNYRKNADRFMCLVQAFYGSMRKQITQEFLLADRGTGGHDEYDKQAYFIMTSSYSCSSYSQYKKVIETMVAQLDMAHSLAGKVLGYAVVPKAFDGTFGEYILAHRRIKTHWDNSSINSIPEERISIQQAFQEIDKYNEENKSVIPLIPLEVKLTEKCGDSLTKFVEDDCDLLLVRDYHATTHRELAGTKHFIKTFTLHGWTSAYLILFGGKDIKNLETMFGDNQEGLIKLLKSQKEV